MDAATRMPGDAEGQAAAAGMRRTYGQGPIAIGDELWFQPAVGAMPMPGRVIEVGLDGCLTLQDASGVAHQIHRSLLAEF